MDASIVDYFKLKTVMAKKNYRFYSDPFDINIFGIRATNPIVNTFCDLLGVAYTDENGKPQIMIAPATTDPGFYWLENPMNIAGTAIVVPGQYHSLWTPGLHSGYRALIQSGNIKVYRDRNKNDVLDMDPSTIQEGEFGIDNHHALDQAAPTPTVGKFSAGCQVWAILADFLAMMGLVDKQIAAGLGSLFSYSLLEEQDFE